MKPDTNPMPTALVVDDSKVDQRLAGSLLETRVDVKVQYAGNGVEALELMRIRVALDEAMNNAIQHGNLEASSELRELTGDDYYALLDERRNIAPYRDRKVYVTSRITPNQAEFVIRDEGPGFDASHLPDP